MALGDPLTVTPVAANYPIVITVVLSLLGTTVLTWCLGKPPHHQWTKLNFIAVRIKSIESWRAVSYPRWRNYPWNIWICSFSVVLLVYVDSYLFVASTSILQVGIGLTNQFPACEFDHFWGDANYAEPLHSCVFSFIVPRKYYTQYFYPLTSKVIIYLFLIERVHIVRGGTKSRMEDKLYLFNLLGLIPYCAIVILAIIFRYHALDENGHCYIGLRRESSFPLLIYDLIINVFVLRSHANEGLSYGSVPHTYARTVLLQSRSECASSTSH
jgi:hypothetical protein